MSSISSASSSSTKGVVYPNNTNTAHCLELQKEASVSQIAQTCIKESLGDKRKWHDELESKTVKRAGEVEGVSDPYKPLADTIELTFDAVTRYLPNREALIAARADRLKEIEQLCHNLDNANWTQIILEYKQTPSDLALDGLKACYDGSITVEQFSTLIFCYSLLNQFPDVPIEVQPIFNQDGTVNERAKEFIENTLKCRGAIYSILSPKRTVLEEQEFEVFLEKMRKQPASEQSFFFIKAQSYTSSERAKETLEGTLSINKEISYFVGVNVFHEVSHQESTYRMIPSLSMMQQVLIASAGSVDDVVKITPVIGLSTEEDIVNNSMTDTRDMALPFPGVELPKTADELKAEYDIDFMFHDFYHAFMASEVPAGFRRAFVGYAKAVCKVKEQIKHPMVAEFLDALYERIVDMEHEPFRRYGFRFKQSATEQFMYSVSLSQQHALNRLHLKARTAGSSESEWKSQQEKMLQELVEQQPIKHLARELCQNGFFQCHSIDINDIQKAYTTYVSKTKPVLLSNAATDEERDALQQVLAQTEKMDIYVQVGDCIGEDKNR